MNEKKPSIFQKFLGGDGENDKTKKKVAPKLVLILLALGIVLMFSGSLFQPRKEETAVFSPQPSAEDKAVPTFASKSSGSSVIEKYEKDYEEKLQTALEEVVGVRDVTIIVNLDSSEVKVIEKERETRTQSTDETDRDGGKRTVTDSSINEKPTIIREDSKEAPIVTKVDKPQVRGVLIVAKGADNIEVKKMIVQAVTRTLDVPSHRVSVLPKKQ